METDGFIKIILIFIFFSLDPPSDPVITRQRPLYEGEYFNITCKVKRSSDPPIISISWSCDIKIKCCIQLERHGDSPWNHRQSHD